MQRNKSRKHIYFEGGGAYCASFLYCVILKCKNMRLTTKILLFALLGIATICASWLFEANNDRLIVQTIGTIILFGGVCFFALKRLFQQ